jgi:hypothetical protein
VHSGGGNKAQFVNTAFDPENKYRIDEDRISAQILFANAVFSKKISGQKMRESKNVVFCFLALYGKPGKEVRAGYELASLDPSSPASSEKTASQFPLRHKPDLEIETEIAEAARKF